MYFFDMRIPGDNVTLSDYNFFVNHVLEVVLKITNDILADLKLRNSKVLTNEYVVEMSNFFFNLYNYYPQTAILDFVQDKVIDEIIFENRQELRNRVERLFDERDDPLKLIIIRHEKFYKTFIKDLNISKKNDELRYVIIKLDVGMVKDTPVRIGLSFYDNNDKKIKVGKSIDDLYYFDLGEGEGVVGFDLTIMNIANVSRVEVTSINGEIQYEKSVKLTDQASNNKQFSGIK